MKSFSVLALSLLALYQLLSFGAVRIAGVTPPGLAAPWAFLIAVALLSLAARGAGRAGEEAMKGSRFVAATVLLAMSASAMYALWDAFRRPLSPLVVEVSDASHPARAPRMVELESLDLSERRYLARLVGKRRDFALEVKGFLMVTRAGRHRFELECDDWCELRLDGAALAQGEGRSSASLELEPGVKGFELEYRQGSGPASLGLSWDPPGPVELLPIESYLAGSFEAFGAAGFRFRAAARWTALGAFVIWSASLALLLVRGAESTRRWIVDIATWWRSPPHAPTEMADPRAWVAASGLLLALGAIAQWTLPARLESLAREYAVNPRRGPFVLERVEIFPQYLFFLAALCLAIALAFRLRPPGDRDSALESPGKRLRFGLVVVIGILLGWGAILSQSEWVRYGRPCYDGYCDYAERVRDVITSPSSRSWGRLRTHVAGNYHANSPVGPLAIAGLSLAMGQTDVVPAYRLLSALATLGTLLLLIRIGRRELGLRLVAALVAAALFAASGSVQRSFLFPQTDALAMFFFALGAERTLAWAKSPGVWRYLAATLAITLALLTKLSALPLAAIAFVLAARPDPDRWKDVTRLGRDLARAAALVAPPLLVTGAFVLALRTANNVRTELHRIETLDSRLSFHVVATLVTLLPLLVALALTLRRRWRSEELLLAGAVGIYLVGLWASGASGWERFYLNAMPLALPLAVGRFSLLRELHEPRTSAILFLGFVIAQAARMLMHLYNGA